MGHQPGFVYFMNDLDIATLKNLASCSPQI